MIEKHVDPYQVYRYRATLTILALITVAGLVSFISGLFGQPVNTIRVGASAAGVAIFGTLLLIAWRWKVEWAGHTAMILITLLTGVSIVLDPVSRTEFAPSVFIPVVLALIIGNPWWVFGTGIGTLLFPMLLAPGSAYTGITRVPILMLLISGMAVARFLLEKIIQEMQIARAEAQTRAIHLREQATMLELNNRALEDQATDLQHLLDLVNQLETPVVELAEGTLLAPLIGHLDSRRAEHITQHLLTQVSNRRVSLLILDISGVTLIDTGVAAGLIRMVTAVNLLGCRVVLTGISASVAISMTSLGIDLKQVETARSPQEIVGKWDKVEAESALPASSRAKTTHSSRPRSDGKLLV